MHWKQFEERKCTTRVLSVRRVSVRMYKRVCAHLCVDVHVYDGVQQNHNVMCVCVRRFVNKHEHVGSGVQNNNVMFVWEGVEICM